MTIASSLGWLYTGNAPALRGQSFSLAQMSTHHRSAWKHILQESDWHCGARRQTSAATGALAVERVIKHRLNDYVVDKNVYVDMNADLIAEPCQSHCIPLLEVLPPAAAAFFADECNLLEGGGTNLTERRLLAKLGHRIDGSHEEYIRYHLRQDVKDLWAWAPASEVRGHAAFRCVLKSDGVHQRKILATLEQNYCFAKPIRSQTRTFWRRCAFSYGSFT